MVDRSKPRKVPTWEAPTRPVHYPRISGMTKAYNPENIADLSMPHADKRLIRLDEQYTDRLSKLEQEMAYYMSMIGAQGSDRTSVTSDGGTRSGARGISPTRQFSPIYEYYWWDRCRVAEIGGWSVW